MKWNLKWKEKESTNYDRINYLHSYTVSHHKRLLRILKKCQIFTPPSLVNIHFFPQVICTTFFFFFYSVTHSWKDGELADHHPLINICLPIIILYESTWIHSQHQQLIKAGLLRHKYLDKMKSSILTHLEYSGTDEFLNPFSLQYIVELCIYQNET